MNKKMVATFIVGGVALGTIQLTPTSASDDQTEELHKKETELHSSFSTLDKETIRSSNKSLVENRKIPKLTEKYQISTEGKSKEEILNELLRQKATEMGITTEGKDINSLKTDILKEEAKKAGISTEGKSEDVLIKELTETQKKSKPNEEQLRRINERSKQENSKFQSFLKENGISPDGKSLEEIQREILAAKAKELGIPTEGKSLKEIKKELQSTLVLQKAKEEGISTEGKNESTIIKEIREAEIKKEKENKENSK